MKPPFFYVYAVLFGVVLFFELLAIRQKNQEKILTLLVALLWVFIGLMNARVWAEM